MPPLRAMPSQTVPTPAAAANVHAETADATVRRRAQQSFGSTEPGQARAHLVGWSFHDPEVADYPPRRNGGPNTPISVTRRPIGSPRPFADPALPAGSCHNVQ